MVRISASERVTPNQSFFPVPMPCSAETDPPRGNSP